MKEPDDFGNPNRDALHPAFRRKDSVRVSHRMLEKLNPDYRHGKVICFSEEECKALQEERTRGQK